MFARQNISFGNYEWRKKASEKLQNSFSEALWGLIFSAINSGEQLDCLLRDCPDVITCYTLYANGLFTGMFVCLILENGDTRRLSIHGGAVSRSIKDKLLIAKAYIVIIMAILEDGYLLSTTCVNNNTAARKLNEGIGFTQVRSKNGIVYYETDYSHIIHSRLYGYFFKKAEIFSRSFAGGESDKR